MAQVWLWLQAIGIDTSIASSNEVSMAIAKQNQPSTQANKNTGTAKPTLKTLTEEIKSNMIKAVQDGKKGAVENALGNYKVTKKVKEEILNA